MNRNDKCFSSITEDKPWHYSLIRDINTKLSDNSVSLLLFPHTLAVTPFLRQMSLSFIRWKKATFVYEWQRYYFLWVCVLRALICLSYWNWFIQMCIKLSHFWTLQYCFMFLPLPLHFWCISLCFIHGQNQQQSWSQHKCVAYSFTFHCKFFSYCISILCLTCFYVGTSEIWICIQLWQVPVKSTMALKIFSSLYLLQPSHVGMKSWMLW